MQLKDVLQKTTLFFREKGFETARLDTEILLAKALHWDRMKLYLNYEYPLNEQELTACRELVRRRAGGEPVAYITGQKDFYNHTFFISPGVLIPRPDTETLVESVLSWHASFQDLEPEQEFHVVDLGCGSGCIGLSIAAAIAKSKLVAVDSSAQAIEVTTLNAETLGLAERTAILHQSVETLTTQDMLTHFGGLADAVVANPPYIAVSDNMVEANVRKFEPHEALFSDENGLAHIKTWLVKAAQLVRPDGLVMFEIGHEQGAQALKLFEAANVFQNIELIRDLAGINRFVRCTRLAAGNQDVEN
jgi:release factor glutamine methyltransferase